MAVVDELITILGFDTAPGSEQRADRFEFSLRSIAKFGAAAAAVVAGAATAVSIWTSNAARATDATGKFAEANNINVTALSELEFAVQRVGGSTDELRGDIRSLVTQYGDFATAEQALLSLSDQFDGLSAAQAQQLGQQAGLSNSTIQLLRQGRAGIQALREERRKLGPILNENDARVAAEYTDSLLNLQTAFSGIALTVERELTPVLTEANRTLVNLITDNREAIGEGVSAFFEDIPGNVLRTLGAVFPALRPGTAAVQGLLQSLGESEAMGSGGGPTVLGTGQVQRGMVAPFPATGAAPASVRGGDVTVNINGARDPVAVGNEVGRVLGLPSIQREISPGISAPRLS